MERFLLPGLLQGRVSMSDATTSRNLSRHHGRSISRLARIGKGRCKRNLGLAL